MAFVPPTIETTAELDDLKVRLKELNSLYHPENIFNIFPKKVNIALAVVALFILIKYIPGNSRSPYDVSSRADVTSIVLLLFGISAVAIAGHRIWRRMKMREIELRKLNKEFKSRVLAAYPGVEEFSPHTDFPERLYKTSLIFPKHTFHKAFAGDDIKGSHQGVKYRIMDLVTYGKEFRENRFGQRKLVDFEIFRGVLVAADFNKNFSGITLLTTDRSEKKLGRWAKRIQRISTVNSELKVVDLESQVFEDQFVVRSTDPTEARYILSSNFMEQILQVQTLFNRRIQVVFRDNTIMISIPLGYDFMDRCVDIENIKPSEDYLNQSMSHILELFSVLQLDESIWGKGSQVRKAS